MTTVSADDGTEIHYEVSGRGGPSLLFVHGWCSNLRHWDAQAAHFGPHHGVAAVDRRGHGRSEVAATGYDVATHAADLATVMEAEAIGGAVVVGHAGGAPTVLRLAGERPDLVRAVVLVDAIISPTSTIGDPSDRAGTALAAMIDRLGQPDGPAAFEEMYRSFFTDRAGRAGDRVVADACRTPLAVAAAELRSLATDTVALSRRVAQPVLWLTVAPADEEQLAAIFPDVRFAQVPDAGHFPQVEAPEQTNTVIERFVGSA